MKHLFIIFCLVPLEYVFLESEASGHRSEPGEQQLFNVMLDEL